MIKCPKCGKEIEDDMDFCYHCGEAFEENVHVVKAESSVDSSSVLGRNYVENGGNYADAASSTVGSMIKAISIVVLILSIIGSCIIMGQLSMPLGVACLITSVLASLLAYGIGEIVCVLREINSKIK